MRALAIVLACVACGGTPKPATTPVGDAPEPAATPVAAATPPADDKGSCANRTDMFGPFTLTAAQAAARYGRGAAKYTDAPTTKERTIEVCGIPASRNWLVAAKCAGGEPGKQKGRVGSVGTGGRCGAVIDLYKVECPETTYEVFIDIYQCGPGEAFP